MMHIIVWHHSWPILGGGGRAGQIWWMSKYDQGDHDNFGGMSASKACHQLPVQIPSPGSNNIGCVTRCIVIAVSAKHLGIYMYCTYACRWHKRTLYLSTWHTKQTSKAQLLCRFEEWLEVCMPFQCNQCTYMSDRTKHNIKRKQY